VGFEVGGGKKGIRPSMNVTPLVDVVLVLLIIFMVITPMLVKQLSVNVPTKPKDDKTARPDPPDPDEEPQVILRVAADGSAWINRSRVPDAELDAKLKRVFAARADQTLFFDADDQVRFERALAVLDLARGTGLATIAVLTEPVATQ
jgi:biopolymer transport protein ExbD